MSCVVCWRVQRTIGGEGKIHSSECFHLPDFPHVLSENVYPKCVFARAFVFASFNCCRLPKINASTAVSRHHYVVLRLTHSCIAHCHRENEQSGLSPDDIRRQATLLCRMCCVHLGLVFTSHCARCVSVCVVYCVRIKFLSFLVSIGIHIARMCVNVVAGCRRRCCYCCCYSLLTSETAVCFVNWHLVTKNRFD